MGSTFIMVDGLKVDGLEDAVAVELVVVVTGGVSPEACLAFFSGWDDWEEVVGESCRASFAGGGAGATCGSEHATAAATVGSGLGSVSDRNWRT